MSMETNVFHENILGLRISHYASGEYKNNKYANEEYLVKYQNDKIRSFHTKEEALAFVDGIIYQTGRFLKEKNGPY